MSFPKNSNDYNGSKRSQQHANQYNSSRNKEDFRTGSREAMEAVYEDIVETAEYVMYNYFAAGIHSQDDIQVKD